MGSWWLPAPGMEGVDSPVENLSRDLRSIATPMNTLLQHTAGRHVGTSGPWCSSPIAQAGHLGVQITVYLLYSIISQQNHTGMLTRLMRE